MNGNFESRHLGPNDYEIKQMLEIIGADSISSLLSETIPEDIALNKDLNLPDGISEHEFLTEIQRLSQKNKLFDTYIGLDTTLPLLQLLFREIFLKILGGTQLTLLIKLKLHKGD